MDRYICIHGHFYQPPRENPWLEAVEVQDSAYPFHDWNERINAECYAPNTASRISADGRILNIVNNYSNISFNFGPTLLSWMELRAKETYDAVLEADRVSREKFSGHGSAIAQAYNHMIMPLANKRDKYTQVAWGIKDFRYRFGREPEGMWLPETAVDLETLDIMAEMGIKFTILAPRQAYRVRPLDKPDDWTDVTGGKIDPTMAYVCRLPSGRSISIFFYDGPISQGIAFENLLASGETFARRLVSAFNDDRSWPQIVHIATDGETYGHHHHFGDMALAYCMHFVESNDLAKITNYAAYLENHPPTRIAEIFENSSWSCVHGVERWKDNCGCNSGMHPGWHQLWRRPLREALDWLRDRCVTLFEHEGRQFLKDPWAARNDYIDVILNRSVENVESFLSSHASRQLSHEEKIRTLLLLGMERCAMLMYTSCGWFFDEISGIETVQVLAYASRMIQLAQDIEQNFSLEDEFIGHLAKIPSNVMENGAKVYDKYVKPSKVDILRVAAHYVISSLFTEYPEKVRQIYSYRLEDEVFERLVAGRTRLAAGRSRITANLTWENQLATFAAVYLGDHNVIAGVRKFEGDEVFHEMYEELRTRFETGDTPEVVRSLDKHFRPPYNYSLWHLFKDERRRALGEIIKPRKEEAESVYRGVYEANYAIMTYLQSLGNPIPDFMTCAAEQTINTALGRIFTEEFNIDKLNQVVSDAQKFAVSIDKGGIGLSAIMWIDDRMRELAEKREGPEAIALMEKIREVLRILYSLPLELDLWRAQNTYFLIKNELSTSTEEKAGKGEDEAKGWAQAFNDLGNYLGVKV